MVGEPDPAIVLHFDPFGGGTFGGINVKIFDCAVFDLLQFAVRHPHQTFVQDKEFLEVIGFTMPPDQPVRPQTDRCSRGVGDGLVDGEHEFVVHRDGPVKDQPGPIVPDQSHRGGGGQHVTGFYRPQRIRTGDRLGGDPIGCGITKDGIIGVRRANRDEQVDVGRGRINRFAVIAQ